MIGSLAYTNIFGFPIIFYLGILTYLSFSATALFGYLYYTGRVLLPFKWHPRLAVFSLVLGFIHGLLGLSVYLGF